VIGWRKGTQENDDEPFGGTIQVRKNMVTITVTVTHVLPAHHGSGSPESFERRRRFEVSVA
jgi:hypothetical protein